MGPAGLRRQLCNFFYRTWADWKLTASHKQQQCLEHTSSKDCPSLCVNHAWKKGWILFELRMKISGVLKASHVHQLHPEEVLDHNKRKICFWQACPSRPPIFVSSVTILFASHALSEYAESASMNEKLSSTLHIVTLLSFTCFQCFYYFFNPWTFMIFG